MEDMDPLGIFVVTSGTRGDRLLFRYPYESEDNRYTVSRVYGRNPYATRSKVAEDHHRSKSTVIPSGRNANLDWFSDKILANLLAVKSSLCKKKFNVKIDEIRFIGFPMKMYHVDSKPSSAGHMIITVNVVFALNAKTCTSAVDSYHDLAKQLSVTVCHEERRCQYLSTQAKIMMAVHDEVAALPEDSLEPPFKLILQRSQLARELKSVFDSLVSTGVVQMHINRWIQINFCLPHKIHVITVANKVMHIEPDVIQKCLTSLRQYHGILLLVEEQELLDSLPMDCTPTLVRLVQIASPLKNLQTLALDADLSLSQVFQLASHLVYWAKATIIYPLCETNMYVLSPQANTHVNSSLAEVFVEQFPTCSLHMEMSEFSLPTQLRVNRDFLERPHHQAQRVQKVVWMLRHRLLMQLHTYMFLVPPVSRRDWTQDANLQSASELPKVEEESWLSYFLDDSGLNRPPSPSDIASVNSDESIGPAPGAQQLSQLSKSPSVGEMMSDGTVITEETKAQWRMQESLLSVVTPEVKAAILKCPAAKNTEDLKVFARLCPYFNGQYHLEEIMYFENLRRSQLITLLDKFKEVLILCSHQDPATAFYAG
ncbi:GATOR1 complex protein NPRL3-like [Haliotis cracherodii]|uniref:GATOR1 complex protein NPRL3-like n=1 Tax=Haliotis cracherodii TaxID=6455 RepID=UPI0039ECA7C5